MVSIMSLLRPAGATCGATHLLGSSTPAVGPATEAGDPGLHPDRSNSYPYL
jgi:hypothetical protein